MLAQDITTYNPQGNLPARNQNPKSNQNPNPKIQKSKSKKITYCTTTTTVIRYQSLLNSLYHAYQSFFEMISVVLPFKMWLLTHIKLRIREYKKMRKVNNTRPLTRFF